LLGSPPRFTAGKEKSKTSLKIFKISSPLIQLFWRHMSLLLLLGVETIIAHNALERKS
jgi:hypothetical protein